MLDVPLPTPGLPLLEYDGTFLGQSMSIARFVAKEYGLDGKKGLEGAKVDMMVECCNDFLASCESWVVS